VSLPMPHEQYVLAKAGKKCVRETVPMPFLEGKACGTTCHAALPSIVIGHISASTGMSDRSDTTKR
jgi:hypothetical protein